MFLSLQMGLMEILSKKGFLNTNIIIKITRNAYGKLIEADWTMLLHETKRQIKAYSEIFLLKTKLS
ncbi:hypothetical protein ES705_13324 [subsurface metagenome]